MKNKLTKLIALLLSILAITCFAFACTPDSGTTGGGSENGEQNQEIENGNDNSGTDVTQEDNDDDTPKHTHSYTLKYDDNKHWQECSCGDKKDTATHSGGTATCKTKAKCCTCDQEYGEIGTHEYVNGRCECLEYEPTYYTDGLVFELYTDNQSYYVDDYNGNATDVVIPSIYQNMPVTSIGYGAFEYCSSLTSVNYLGTIDEWVQIEFDSTSANPLDYAYNLYINDELITVVKLSSATKINDYAFYHCRSLTSIEIPNSVTSIGSSAFSGCNSLTIYCQANSKPSGWSSFWNSYRPVIWGYTGE